MEKIIKKIIDGTVEVLPLDDLTKKLRKNKPLIVKLGADPTAPNLHLGHTVVLQKMRDLQDLGHSIKFLIGDFTARIGDPTGKSKTRPPLGEEEIKKNVATYVAQIGKVLDMSKAEIVFNAHWLDALTSREWLKIAGKVTVARILEREDFKKRYTSGAPIGFHEMFYPILQGYDSVFLKADIEIGGTDQTFNMLMGRFLQEEMRLEPQVVITMPLLVGLDGVQKMSKSLHNDIGLLEEPNNAFGKLMSISDKAMIEYYKILLRYNAEQINTLNTIHPMDAKKQLAHKIIERYWGIKAANEGLTFFEKTFQKKEFDGVKEFLITYDTYNIIDLIICIDSNVSKSDVKRLLLANAVSINGNKINSLSFEYKYKNDDVIRIGKHIIYKLVKK